MSVSVLAATVAAATFFSAVAKRIFSAANDEALSVDQHIRKFLACVVVDALHGRARYVHLRGAFLLRESRLVDQADRFIFVDRHHDRVLDRLPSGWAK